MFVDEFNEYVNKHLHQFPKYNTLQHKSTDLVTSVFHFWIQLIDSDTYRILKPDHQIIHELTIAYHAYVTNHSVTKKLKETHNSNEELFIYAYFISCELQLYLSEKIPVEIKDKYFEFNQHMSYYELTDMCIDENLREDFLKLSRQLHYQLINDSWTKNRIMEVLNNSYELTLKYLEVELHMLK